MTERPTTAPEPILIADYVAEDPRLQVLDRLGDWRLQIGIWKWAVQGDVTESDALTSEFPNRFATSCAARPGGDA
jgi:hypothetical protein